MGYTTDFNGCFVISGPLTPEQIAYVNKLAETRRMRRDEDKARVLPDPVRAAVGLPVGTDGEFFVGGSGDFGQGNDDSVLDHNAPPDTQPGLWCQWVIVEERQIKGVWYDYRYTPHGTTEEEFQAAPKRYVLQWDEGEKFYNYTRWLKYLIDKLFIPWGLMLNGEVRWSGEDSDDFGIIVVKDNVIEIYLGEQTYSPSPVEIGGVGDDW